MSVNVKDTKIEKIKPRNGDVLLEHIPREESKTILIQEDPTEDGKDVQRFIVRAIGRDVRDVKVGDEVGVSWTRVTEPFKVLSSDANTIQVGITSYKELLYVVE